MPEITSVNVASPCSDELPFLSFSLFLLGCAAWLADLSSPDALGREVQSPDHWTAREFPGLSFY